MTTTYNTSLTGMLAANYGLQVISNNLANMQTKGFKRSDIFYSSLSNDSQHTLGAGVSVGGQSTNYSAGDYQNSNNPSDLAIIGEGFFIIKLKNGEWRYTREGEFEFNQEGILIDKHSGGFVQGYDKHGALTSIHQFGPKSSPGKPTHAVDLNGEWVIIELEDNPLTPADPDPFKSKFERVKFDVNTIFDEQGKAHTIHLEFEAPGTPGTGKNPLENLKWNLISATCDDANISFNPQYIEFSNDTNGYPQKDNHTIQLTLNGNQTIRLNFGEHTSDEHSSVRLNKKSATTPQTSIKVLQHDGYSEGQQIGFAFNEDGLITYVYDNGQTKDGIHIALARFDDMEHTLIPIQDNLFRTTKDDQLIIGRPGHHGFGTIQPKQLEGSNVNSTMEFGNIVVLQRMFQACSQLMDIDKQLLDELMKK